MVLSGIKGSAAGAARIVMLGQGLVFTAQLISVSILSRLLTPEDFGAFAIALALVGVATIFADMGLSLSSIRAKHISNEEKSNLFWVNLLIGSLLAIILWFAASYISSFYGLGLLEDVIKVLSVCLVLAAATAQFRAEMSRMFLFRKQTIIDISSPWIALGAAVYCAFHGMGIWALVVQQLTIFSCQLIGLAATAGWFPSFPSRHTSIREHLRFGVNTAGLQVVNYVSNSADVFVLGKFQTPAVLGIYNRAYQLYRIPGQQLANPLGRVAIPYISKSFHRGTMAIDAPKVQLLMSYSVLQGFALLAGMASPLVRIFLGEQWGVAVPIVQLLCIGGIFQALSWSYFWVFVASNQTGAQFRWSLVGRTIMIVSVVTAARSGAEMVALAVSLGYACVWLLLTIFVLPRAGLTRMSMVLPVLRPVVLAFSIFFVSAIATQQFLAAQLFAVQLLGGVTASVAVAGLFMLIPSFRDDLKNIMLIARRKKG